MATEGLAGASEWLSGTIKRLAEASEGLAGVSEGPAEASEGQGSRGGDGQTDGRTDGRTYRFPLCSTGLRPLRGRCPKKEK